MNPGSKPPPPPPERPPAQLPDPKAELEARLVEHAMAPWKGNLSPEADFAARLFVELLVETHPEMQRAIEARLERDRRGGTAEPAGEGRPRDPGRRAPDASGVVARGAARQTTQRRRRRGA